MSAALRLRRVERALDPPHVNARGAWSQRASIELALGPPGATRGLGEAAPLPDYSPDRLEDCERALAAVARAPWLVALDGAPPRELLDAVARGLPRELPAARFALETALLDRAARAAGRPLWQLLADVVLDDAGGAGDHLAGGVERGAESLAVCALLPSAEPRRALALALEHTARGISTFKLKVGPERLSVAQEATLAELRRELGPATALRLDANRSLSRADLGATLERIGRYAIEFLEEPIAEPTPDELAHSPCPLALDESLQGMPAERLLRLLERGACAVLILKPTALGGFGACIELARAARAHAVEAVVTHALEGPIGWAACAHLAFALGGSRAAGLWPLAHQAASLPRLERGRLQRPLAPGLGAEP